MEREVRAYSPSAIILTFSYWEHSFLRRLAATSWISGNPTLNINIKDVAAVPILEGLPKRANVIAKQCRASSRIDWNAYERSWDFQSLPIRTACSEPTPSLESSYAAWITQNLETIAEMQRLEEENNRLFIDAYGLAEELTPDVPIEHITLTVNPAYRYGGKLTEEDQWTRFRQDTMKELVSYAIGCMMGRYSLDAPGLIYAHSRGAGFDPSRYTTFPADQTASSLTDSDWFEDDAAHRLIRFISVAWDAGHLEENLAFLATTSRQGTTSRAARLFAATSATAFSRTICRPTRSAPSTGSSQAASRRHFDASSTCTATTKAHWPGCVPST